MTLKGKNINCVLSVCLLFSWTTASINSLYISEQMKSATQTKVKNSLLTWMTFHNSESIKMLKSCSCFMNYFLFSCFFRQHLFFKLQDELSQHHIKCLFPAWHSSLSLQLPSFVLSVILFYLFSLTLSSYLILFPLKLNTFWGHLSFLNFCFGIGLVPAGQ